MRAGASFVLMLVFVSVAVSTLRSALVYVFVHVVCSYLFGDWRERLIKFALGACCATRASQSKGSRPRPSPKDEKPPPQQHAPDEELHPLVSFPISQL